MGSDDLTDGFASSNPEALASALIEEFASNEQSAVAEFRKAFRSNEDSVFRLKLAVALLGSQDGRRLCLKAAEADPNQGYVVQHLGDLLPNEDVEQTLLRLSYQVGVQVAAVQALAKSTSDTSLRRIRELLACDIIGVQTQAITALADRGDRTVRPQIEKLLASPERRLRIASLTYIAKLPDQRTAETLQTMVACDPDPYQEVPHLALWWLARLAPDVAKEAASEWLAREPDEAVRWIIQGALKEPSASE